MLSFLEDKFGVVASLSSLTRALQSVAWTKKVTRRVASQREPLLRLLYSFKLAQLQSKSFQYVFIDECGREPSQAQRREGWAPKGKTPVYLSDFVRERRHQFITAYTQEGEMLTTIYRGSTDSLVFEDFIRRLLPFCGRYPEPKSILIMDNARFHRPRQLEQMCSAVGVEIVFLPPYSPDLNPIEELFGEIKDFMKKEWYKPHNLGMPFGVFLKWCIRHVGKKRESAEGHFRHSGIKIEHWKQEQDSSDK